MTFLTDQNRADWNDGQFHGAYSIMGSHAADDGLQFAVWAPNAHSVSVVGAFNNWDGRENPMEKDDATGIWSAHVPGIGQWTLYKFELKKAEDSPPFLKSDPYAKAMELRPKTASLAYELDGFSWDDDDWIANRGDKQSPAEPISVYEVHLASWRLKGPDNNEYLTYRELAAELVPYVNECGFTHIEFMPIAEYPYDGSWGYQVTGYFAPTSRFGEPKDLMYLIDACHKAGIGVIMDWVPAHFPKDLEGLQMFDSSPVYEHEDPLKREQKDWGTHIFDYGKAGVRNFLLSNAHYWCEKFHIDGLRVDAVASMLYLDYSKNHGEWSPNKYGGNENLEAIEFLKQFNTIIHREHPGILTFAEESTSWEGVTKPVHDGGLGFDYKWNMGWMNDTLEYIEKSSGERGDDPNKITFPMMYNNSENFLLPFSHDEVVHLKNPMVRKSYGSEHQQFANLRLLYTYLFTHPGKKLLFMGDEFAETSEWAEDRALHWHLLDYDRHRGVKRLVTDLNELYRSENALQQLDRGEAGFEWIELGDRMPALFAYLRKAEDASDHLMCVMNFSERMITDHYLGPFEGVQYAIELDSDSHHYGGEDRSAHNGSMSEQRIFLAPYSALVLKPVK
jgi:1,4-alpha-glucan branching enzyme